MLQLDPPDVDALLAEIDGFPLDRASIPQERLDLANRRRTSLFPWRGQFSPELIELVLDTYGAPGHVVLDPFVGSGTTLFEAARRTYACYGAEINPAAVVMASTAHFVNVTASDRLEHVRTAKSILEKHLPLYFDGDLFAQLAREGQFEVTHSSIEQALKAMLRESQRDPLVYNIIANAVVRGLAANGRSTVQSLFQGLNEHAAVVEGLPFSERLCRVLHSDARRLAVGDASVDLIVTSPPYINVFNYHQNCRPAMELMGWDLLHVAKSELGSNRKNRGNRFFTVVQYALDMLQALLEMRRVIRDRGRIVIVIGRESKVRGVSFQNGRILAALAVGAAGLQLILRQERKFKNKFGKDIYEDILHLTPADGCLGLREAAFARELAKHVLAECLPRATGEVHDDVVAAIARAAMINASPFFPSTGSD